MSQDGHPRVLSRVADGSWSVCERDGRLVFLNGDSAVEIPVEPPLRWCLDGEDMSFEQALDTVPDELHGWMSLAAIIGLRHCLGGLVTGAALPPGYHQWVGLAGRAEPLGQWMAALGALDGMIVPHVPDGVDDGLAADADGPDAGTAPAG
jgi:hypothetical protein